MPLYKRFKMTALLRILVVLCCLLLADTSKAQQCMDLFPSVLAVHPSLNRTADSAPVRGGQDRYLNFYREMVVNGMAVMKMPDDIATRWFSLLRSISRGRYELAASYTPESDPRLIGFGAYRLGEQGEGLRFRYAEDAAHSAWVVLGVHSSADRSRWNTELQGIAEFAEGSDHYQKGVRILKKKLGEELPIRDREDYSWSWRFPGGVISNRQEQGIISINQYQLLSGDRVEANRVILELSDFQLFVQKNGQHQPQLLETRDVYKGMITVRHPKTANARQIMSDLLARLNLIDHLMGRPSIAPNERIAALRHFLVMMYGFYNTVPFLRGSASIGNVLFDVIYRHYFAQNESDYFPLSPYGLDVEAMVMEQNEFVDMMMVRLQEVGEL